MKIPRVARQRSHPVRVILYLFRDDVDDALLALQLAAHDQQIRAQNLVPMSLLDSSAASVLSAPS